MSKSDFPPGYDESHAPLYGPPGMNYPPPPQYGFPAYGGAPSGQPSAPYPPGQNVPPYPGQPGGYSAQPGGYSAQPGGYSAAPYQGFPLPAGAPGAAYPSHAPMPPPIIPPTIPSDVIDPDTDILIEGDGFAASGADWDSLSVRHSFIRKVYLILASQLLVTTAIVAVFTFVEPVRDFVQQNPAIYWASFAVYFITHIVLVCCKGPRRKHPWNIILLMIFTLAMSYMTGAISSQYETKAVFLALGITAVVCIAVTVFCFQTKVDFTKCQGLFCVLGIVMLVVSIISVIVLSFKYIPWLHMLYAAIGAIIYTLFLAYHTQLLIGNRKYAISPEEYIFAAITIYVDIIQIFLFLLQIIGLSSR